MKGLSYSLLLHSALLLIIGIGIPILFDRDRERQPIAISVEVLPIRDISNLPTRRAPVKKETPKPKPTKKKEPPKPKPVSKEVAKPKPEPVPAPAPKAKAKPKPKEKAKPEPKKKDDAFDQLLKDLTEQQDSSDTKEAPKVPTQDSTKSRSDRYDPTIPLSISEKDAIRSQFARHWRLPAGVKGDYTLSVEVRILVRPDGSVQQAGIANHQAGRYARDPIFRAAADSALRAVKLASPLKGLPRDKYNSWKDMTVNFDPKEMLF